MNQRLFKIAREELLKGVGTKRLTPKEKQELLSKARKLIELSKKGKLKANCEHY